MTDFEDEILRRHFVAIATSKYDYPETYRQLSGVGAEGRSHARLVRQRGETR